jgi:hypothetical protein
MKLRVLYHGHCFDGVASAATFTRFYNERINPGADIQYGGLLHRPGNLLFEGNMFDGDENAIVDFKYSPSDKLTWWFDHHQSAFLTPEDEAHFQADHSGKKFLDAMRKSCTEFIADVAHSQFGFNDEPLRDLTVRPLSEVATSAEVAARFEPILKQHRETLETIRRKATFSDGVVSFDLIDEGYEGFNKFIPYYLFPEASYTVALTRAPQRTKISVGSNPWAPRPRRHNIATLCERYGGGGHAVVGAISFGTDEVEKGRAALREIVAELKTG